MTQMNSDNGLRDWKTEHQAVINRTMSGLQDPAISPVLNYIRDVPM